MGYKAALITISDKCSNGECPDTVSPAVAEILKAQGLDLIYTSVIRKERHIITSELIKCEYEIDADLIITAGGTGLSKRDVTPEATRDVIDYEIPAITQAMLYYSLQLTPRAMLSRAVAGVRNNGLIINLPGNEKAACENLHAVADTLIHALDMVTGKGLKQ